MARRSGSENSDKSSKWSWPKRLSLAAGLLVIGAFSISVSVANVLVKSVPASAYALAPGNGKIAALYAENDFSLHPEAAATSPAASFARRALLADPTAVEALTVLGFQAQLRGNTARAGNIFAHSTKLSRRELRPRIWAIENAVNRGDIAEALRNYDVALRTSYRAQGLLFPTLASALPEPRIRAELLDILQTQPEWAERFISHVATSGVEPQAAIQFFSEGRKFDLPVKDEHRVRIVNALIDQNEADAAWTYYKSFRSNIDRKRSRDPNFLLMVDTRAVFDWRIGTDAGLSAAVLMDGDRGLIDFAAPPGAGGILLQQTQLLPPGVYRLNGHSSGIDQPDRTRPYWSLTCQDGREVGRISLLNSREKQGSFSGSFTVPQGCQQQTLALIVRASEDILGVSGQIREAQLVPVRRPNGG